jgi:hypothetical protein
MNDYIMPKSSAKASVQLEYSETLEEMNKDYPEALKIMEQADNDKISVISAIREINNIFAK